MRKGYFVAAMMALILALSLPVFAQEVTGSLEEGDKELALMANATFMEDSDSYMIFVSYGWFINPQGQVAVMGVISGSEDVSGLVGLEYKHHFIKDVAKRSIPYAAVDILTTVGEEDENVAVYGAGVGMKTFITEQTLWYVEAKYLTCSDCDSGMTTLNLGLSYLFK